MQAQVTHTHTCTHAHTCAPTYVWTEIHKYIPTLMDKQRFPHSVFEAWVKSHKHSHPGSVVAPAESFNPMRYCLSLDFVIKGWQRDERERQRDNFTLVHVFFFFFFFRLTLYGSLHPKTYTHITIRKHIARAKKQQGVCQCWALTSQWPQTDIVFYWGAQ